MPEIKPPQIFSSRRRAMRALLAIAGIAAVYFLMGFIMYMHALNIVMLGLAQQYLKG